MISERLVELYKHYEEIMQELSSDSIMNYVDRYKKLMKEETDLKPIVDAYILYQNAEKLEKESLKIFKWQKKI